MALHQVLFYLILLLIPTQLGRHNWPDWSLVLGRRVDYLAPTVYLTDLLIIGLLVAWIGKKQTRREIGLTVKTHIPLFLTCLFCIGTNIWFSTNHNITLYMWTKGLEYVLFLYYMYKTKPPVHTVVQILSVSILYTGAIALMQFAFQHTIGGPLWTLGERTFSSITPGVAKVNWCFFSKSQCVELLRPYATFPHPNVLGGFLAALLPMVIIELSKEKQKRIRSLLFITIIIDILTLALTFSRSAWVVGFLGLCIVFFIVAKKMSRVVFWTSLIIACICCIAAFPYVASLTTDTESVFMRVDLIQASLYMVQHHIATGVGLGMFLPNLPLVLSQRSLYFLQPVHNIFLLYGSETGLLGVILAVLGICAYRRLARYRKIQKVLFIPIVLFCLLGLVDHYPITVQQGQLLMAVFLAFPFFSTKS